MAWQKSQIRKLGTCKRSLEERSGYHVVFKSEIIKKGGFKMKNDAENQNILSILIVALFIFSPVILFFMFILNLILSLFIPDAMSH